MRPVPMLMAMFCLIAPPAHADPGLEARVLRLEAQVKALQEGLKNAVQAEKVYSIKTIGDADSCLSSGGSEPSAAKTSVFVGKCRTDDRNGGVRNWKIAPAQP
jgi:hypothetical protein